MIDIPNHLLQKLEDGPLTIEEFIQMCEAPHPQGGPSGQIGFRDSMTRGGHLLSWGWSTL